MLHKSNEQCHSVLKSDIKDLEISSNDLHTRISAIEPIVMHNRQEIDSMRKLQLATLVTAVCSCLGVITGLMLYILRNTA